MPDEPIIAVSGEPRRKRGCLTGCAVTALVLVLVGGVGALWWTHRLSVARERYAAGLRSRIAEWQEAHPPLPEEQNSAKTYDRALALHVPWTGILGKSPAFDSAGFDARDEAVEMWLADNNGFLTVLGKAQGRPGYDSGFRPGFIQKLPPQLSIDCQPAIRFLLVKARNAAQSGRSFWALEWVGMALRVARDAGSDETMVGPLMSRALEESVLSALQHVLCESEPDASSLRAMISKIDRHLAARVTPAAALRGERVMVWTAWSLLLDGEASVIRSLTQKDPGEFFFVAWRFIGADLRDVRQFDEAFEEALAAAAKPYPDKLEAVRAVAEKPREDRLVWSKVGSQVLSAWAGTIQGDAQSLARLRIARLALGCRLYRLEKGAYPGKLAALSAAFPDLFAKLPEDPFCGKPFEYARTKTGCSVSNVGKDGKVRGEAKPGLDEIVFELKK
ncbi:MAG: hypothetical protein ACYTGB_06890 [Planctomycetota bacterium]